MRMHVFGDPTSECMRRRAGVLVHASLVAHLSPAPHFLLVNEKLLSHVANRSPVHRIRHAHGEAVLDRRQLPRSGERCALSRVLHAGDPGTSPMLILT